MSNNGRLVKSVSTKNFSVELIEYAWDDYSVQYTEGHKGPYELKTTDLKHAMIVFDDTLIMLEGH